MGGLLLALVGVSGTLVGIFLKAGLDKRAEKSRRSREDVVWRRQNALASAAEFLAATSAIHALARTINDLAEEIPMARAAGHTETVQQLMGQLQQEHGRRRTQLERANDALSRLSILLEQETFLTASKYLEAVTVRPRDPQNALAGAALNNLLRADLGLPPRQIDPDKAITAEEALDRIEEARARPPSGTVS